jgi:hypothetical protein
VLIKLIITSSPWNLLSSFIFRKLLQIIIVIIAVEIIEVALKDVIVIPIRQILLVLIIYQPFNQ